MSDSEAPSPDTPGEGSPVGPEGAPSADTPPEGTPAQGAPPADTPTADTPTADTPAQGAPPVDTPTEGTPTGDTPTEGAPPADTPAQGAPPVDTPTQGAPTGDTPSAETPPEGTPAQGAPGPAAPASTPAVAAASVATAPTTTTPVATAAVATAEPPKSRARRIRRRVRSVSVVVLVVLCSILVLASTVGLWAYRQVYNTDVFVGHVDAIVASHDVQTNLANYLTDQIMTAINPEQRARDALPPQADALIAPMVSAIRGFVNQSVEKVVSSDQFRQLVDNSVRLAHQGAINLLEGKKTAGLTVKDNQVVFNTLPMIDQVLQQISQQGLLGNRTIPALSTPTGQPSAQLQELATKLGVTLPPDFGQLVVFKSDSIKSAQQALHLIKRLLVLLVIVTLVLIALTLVLSLHRLRTLAELGIGIAVAMLVAWVVTKAITRDVLKQVGTPAGRQTLLAVGNDFLGSLRAIAVILTIIGLVVALIAFLSGQSSSARWIRSKVTRLWRPADAAPAGRSAGSFGGFLVAHRDGLRILGAAIGVLILLLAGLTWTTLIVAVVIVVLWEAAISFLLRRTAGAGLDGSGAGPPVPPGPTSPTDAAPIAAGGAAT